MAAQGAGPSQAEVTWEDQKNINSFSNLNLKKQDIESLIAQQKRSLEDLDDASAELMLADDDAAARLRAGDCFLHTPKEDAEAKLDELTEAAKVQLADLEEQLKGIQQQMADLKVVLYARFGSSINLEE